MRVAHLSLGDFRNYRTAELALQPGANLLVGKNGQGKTNLVEAIAYFSSLRSHRVTGDGALVRLGAESAIARMRVVGESREVVLELQIHRDRPNRAQVNGNPVRPREVTRWFSSVAFVPEDLMIVRGEPTVRRRFLDEALVARHPVAAGALADYDKALRQRTALLKAYRTRGGAPDSLLEVWDDQLIEFGTQIMLARRELVRDLRAPLAAGYSALVDTDHRPEIEIQESMLEVLQTQHVSRETSPAEMAAPDAVSRETLAKQFRAALDIAKPRERERGVTLVGPHRDDAAFALNGLPVKGYASHGESWSYALSLKLALAELLRAESAAGDPVIILDDVFAELDASRRGRLLAAVGDFEQVIVTAAVESDVPDELSWHRIGIDAGTIQEAHHAPTPEESHDE